MAIERVVLRHMRDQIAVLAATDRDAVAALRRIIADEQEHHDLSAARLPQENRWTRPLERIVAASTEAVIWLGMRL